MGGSQEQIIDGGQPEKKAEATITFCQLCYTTPETAHHLLTKCFYAKEVLIAVCS
jgi:hypothetical protein